MKKVDYLACSLCFALAVGHSAAFAQSCEFEPVRDLGANKVSISPDGKLIALYQPEGAGVIQQTESGHELLQLRAPLSSISMVAGEAWVFAHRKTNSGRSLDAISIRSGRNASLSCSGKGEFCWVSGDVYGNEGQWLSLKNADEGGGLLLRTSDLSEVFNVQSPSTFSLDKDAKRALVYTKMVRDAYANSSGGASTFQVVSLPDKKRLVEADVGMPIRSAGFISGNLVWAAGGQKYGKLVIWDISSNMKVLSLDGYSSARTVPGDRFFLLYPAYNSVKPALVAAINAPGVYESLPETSGAFYFSMFAEDLIEANYYENGEYSSSVIMRVSDRRKVARIHDGQILTGFDHDTLAPWYVTSKGAVLDKASFSPICRIPEYGAAEVNVSASNDGQWVAVEVGGKYDKAGQASLYRIIGEDKIAARMAEMKRRSTALSAKDRAAAQKLFKQAFELFQSGEFDASVISFKKGLDIDPANAVAHFYLAETYARQKNPALARRHYELARDFGGNSKEAVLAESRLAALPN